MMHCFVENQLVYREASAYFEEQGTRWFTTSPCLVEHLQSRGLEAESIEHLASQNDINSLGDYALNLGRILVERLNCSKLSQEFNLPIGNLYHPQFNLMLSTILVIVLL